MFKVENLLGDALRTVQSWFQPSDWQQKNEEAIREAEIRLARDASKVRTDGLDLLIRTAGRAQDVGAGSAALLGAGSAAQLGAGSAAQLGAGSRALQVAARESGNPTLRQGVADLILCASKRPVDPAALDLHLLLVDNSLRKARPMLDRPTLLAALRALQDIRRSLQASAAESRALHDIRRSLQAGAAEIRTGTHAVLQRAAWTASRTVDLAKAWVNQAGDHVLNLAGGTATGAVGGAVVGTAVGAVAGPVGAVVGLGIGAAVGAVTGFLAGLAFGRNWRVLG